MWLNAFVSRENDAEAVKAMVRGKRAPYDIRVAERSANDCQGPGSKVFLHTII
jgi:hypothetical protein